MQGIAQEAGVPLAFPYSLSGTWAFHAGDDPRWADPGFDDSDWQRLKVPKPWGRQGIEADWGWYRLRLELDDKVPEGLGAQPLAVTLGNISSAYELYANGRLVGSLGMKPEPKEHYGHHKTFVIPAELLAGTDDLVLALRVWRGSSPFRTWHAGPYGGPFLLGGFSQLQVRQLRAMMLPLVLSVLYLMVAFYHLHLFVRVRALREYLWYGFLTLGIAAFTLFSSQWKFELALPFEVLKKLEHGTLYLLPALVLELTIWFFAFRPNRWFRLIQGAFVLLTAPIILVPGLSIHRATLDLWSLLALVTNLGCAGLVTWRSFQGDAEARIILFGGLSFLGVSLNDLAVDQGLIRNAELLPLGFAAFVLSMAFSLAYRFTRLYSDMEGLVAERTAQLAEMSAKRRRLFADIVHDLGTPLSVISGYVQAMGRGTLQANAERLNVVNQELELIGTLVEDLRLLATLDAGEMRLELRAVSAEALLSATARAFNKRASDKGVRVFVEAEADLLLPADEQRLRRVLTNLLGNALRHTPPGGEVRLRAGATADGVVLEVSDTGEGASEELLDRLFERFYRADESRGDGAGSGLGLAIAKSLVELHGGSISATSAPRQGLSVCIVLPKR